MAFQCKRSEIEIDNWRLKLEEYDYELIHRAGKGNANADALSQNPITDESQVNNVN